MRSPSAVRSHATTYQFPSPVKTSSGSMSRVDVHLDQVAGTVRRQARDEEQVEIGQEILLRDTEQPGEILDRGPGVPHQVRNDDQEPPEPGGGPGGPATGRQGWPRAAPRPPGGAPPARPPQRPDRRTAPTRPGSPRHRPGRQPRPSRRRGRPALGRPECHGLPTTPPPERTRRGPRPPAHRSPTVPRAAPLERRTPGAAATRPRRRPDRT